MLGLDYDQNLKINLMVKLCEKEYFIKISQHCVSNNLEKEFYKIVNVVMEDKMQERDKEILNFDLY